MALVPKGPNIKIRAAIMGHILAELFNKTICHGLDRNTLKGSCIGGLVLSTAQSREGFWKVTGSLPDLSNGLIYGYVHNVLGYLEGTDALGDYYLVPSTFLYFSVSWLPGKQFCHILSTMMFCLISDPETRRAKRSWTEPLKL